MPQTIIDLLNKGIKANNADKFRRGNLINLPAEGSLIVTGDLHGHLRNFEKIVATILTGISFSRRLYTEARKIRRGAVCLTSCCLMLSAIN
jgi:hypothetical protein